MACVGKPCVWKPDGRDMVCENCRGRLYGS